ncbi:hypothetical protein FGO68_gene8983 [Halteria grandinella]|uniref:Uncharacterized protein n=1 Tax=Halteria grandinella TaxID=5974 RepID=A0A8J8T1Q0_HALGN|nr:hypothetical protein FGO68_gene8983 [Halteria grandinella]
MLLETKSLSLIGESLLDFNGGPDFLYSIIFEDDKFAVFHCAYSIIKLSIPEMKTLSHISPKSHGHLSEIFQKGRYIRCIQRGVRYREYCMLTTKDPCEIYVYSIDHIVFDEDFTTFKVLQKYTIDITKLQYIHIEGSYLLKSFTVINTDRFAIAVTFEPFDDYNYHSIECLYIVQMDNSIKRGYKIVHMIKNVKECLEFGRNTKSGQCEKVIVSTNTGVSVIDAESLEMREIITSIRVTKVAAQPIYSGTEVGIMVQSEKGDNKQFHLIKYIP